MLHNILITGGAGFVGTALCRSLVELGYEVTSLDNYHSGSVTNHIDGVKYIQESTEKIHDVIKYSPDAIFHLGEYSRVEQSFFEFDKVWQYNCFGTYNVLEFARKTQAKLIYAGSSTKFTNSELGINQSPYAWSKATNTELVKNYGKCTRPATSQYASESTIR